LCAASAASGRHLSKHLTFFRFHSQNLQKVGGVVIAGTAIVATTAQAIVATTAQAIAILLGWDIKIQLWLAPLFPAFSL